MKEFIKDFKDELRYVRYELKDEIYYIYCETKSKKFKHPDKDIITSSIKDTYNKTVDDLPFNNIPVKLVIKMKIYAFYNLTNERKYFKEQLSFLSDQNKGFRRTKRLEKYILDTAATTSSNAAEKMLKMHGINISDTTINRMILKKNLK